MYKLFTVHDGNVPLEETSAPEPISVLPSLCKERQRMSMVKQQAAFLQDAAKLIQFAGTIGIILTGGRLYSTDEEQLAYYKKKLSKTKSSRHCMRLAIDFNFFDLNLKPVVDKEVLLPLASYWKSLNPQNDCGLLWGWDFYHFERKPQTKGEAA